MSRVLIVGGTCGLGRAIALHALGCGDEVSVLARGDSPEMRAVDVPVCMGDYSLPGVAESWLRRLEPERLILSAAEGCYDPLLSAEESRVIAVLKSSFVAPICWLYAAIRLLPRGSAIGWLSSLTGRVPSTPWAAYAASKAGVEHYVRSVRPEAARRGLTITVCFPGCVSTAFHERAGAPRAATAPDPSEIAPRLYQAICAGAEVCSAPMDAEIIHLGDTLLADYYEAASQALS